jgi:hypothetical protein
LSTVIRSSSDASSLLALPTPTSLIITVSVVGVSEEQCERWERELDASLAECGCEMGSKFTAAALGLSAAIGFVARSHGASIRRLAVVGGSAVTVAAGSGKHLALARARRRIMRVADEIRQQELAHHRSAEWLRECACIEKERA